MLGDRETKRSDGNMAWGDHEAQVLATLQSMREKRFLTDLTIECCGKEFAAHRAILCASIPYFHVMYQSGMEEALSGKVNLQTISPEAMTIVLDFVYTGKATSLGDDVQLFEDVIHATHLLQIDYLFKMYLESYKSMLTETHFARILTTMELYNREELSYVVTYLTMNFYKISASDDFLRLTVSQIKLLISHSELKKNCTDVVVQGILRWMKFDTEIRCTYLEDLFTFICVDEITLGYLQVLLNREPLIKNCQPLFNKLVSAVLSKLNEVCTDPELVCFEGGYYHKLISVYNLERRTWSPAVQLAFNVQLTTGVVEYLGHIYFFGGNTSSSPFQPTAMVYKYNPTLNEIVQLKDLCVPVNNPGVGVLNNQFYIVGGRTKQGDSPVVTKTVQRVDPANGESSVVAATIERHRSPFVLPYQGRLYIVGTSHDSSCAVECYDAHRDQWTIITRIPYPYTCCQATLWNDHLVVLCSPGDNSFNFYSFTADLWKSVRFPSEATDESIRGMWSTVCKRDKKPVILLQDSSSGLHIFDPDADSWECLPGKLSAAWCWKLHAFKSS